MKRRILSTFTALVLVFSLFSVPASAATEEIQPRYAGILTVLSGLEITSAGRADCSGEIDLRDGYTADVALVLMRGQDPSFTEVKTWTEDGVSGWLKMDKSYYVLSGYDYVVVMSATVYDEDGKNIEHVDLFSPVTTY